MLILPDYGYPYIIDDVNGPVVPKYNWFYDAGLNDFMIKPIRLLEETTGPTIRCRINGFDFNIPASWNILVVDEDTKIVDTVQISQCSSSNYSAFLMHPDIHDYQTSPIVLLDLFMKESCTHVTIPKMNMILHPVGPVNRTSYHRSHNDDLSYSCLLSPQDIGKYMHNMSAMEIVL